MIDWVGRRKRLLDWWNKLPLARRFAISGGFITVGAMLLCGVLTTTVMTEIIVQRRGDVVSAFGQHLISPIVQNLAPDGPLDAAAIDALDNLMTDPAFTAEFPYLDLWVADGTILYSNTPGLTGQQLPLLRAVTRALQGEMTVRFTDIHSVDYARHHFTTDYIEVLFPLRSRATGAVVAVAQLREVTTALERDLWQLTLSSWVTVAVIAAVVIVALFSIVQEGSRKIERQGRILSRRLAQSHARAARHRELKAVAQRASRSVTELTDKHLRTIGTDLHDGPAQSIGFAVLRLDQLRHRSEAGEVNAIVAEVESVLGGALDEIRAIATALVLPDIDTLDLAQVIDRAVKQHVRRTDAVIAVDSLVEPVHVASEIAVCVFRFIQEGLNNAFHHGLPEGQAVSATIQTGLLKVSITNNYLATEPPRHADHAGIGLYGLRARVQSIGGTFIFEQNDGLTRLEMRLRYV